MQLTFHYADKSIRILHPHESFFGKSEAGTISDKVRRIILDTGACYKVELLTNDKVEVIYENKALTPVIHPPLPGKTKKTKRKEREFIKKLKKEISNAKFTFSSVNGKYRNFQEQREAKKAWKNRFKPSV